MKSARYFWMERYGQFPSTVSGNLVIETMAEYGEYVNEEAKRFTTFPTWEEFGEWLQTNNRKGTYDEIYDFFKSRVQPLEIGREYEFSDDGKDWVRDTLKGYKGVYDAWYFIRLIQDPKQTLIERLKAVQDDTGAVADAIKALEGEK